MQVDMYFYEHRIIETSTNRLIRLFATIPGDAGSTASSPKLGNQPHHYPFVCLNGQASPASQNLRLIDPSLRASTLHPGMTRTCCMLCTDTFCRGIGALSRRRLNFRTVMRLLESHVPRLYFNLGHNKGPSSTTSV